MEIVTLKHFSRSVGPKSLFSDCELTVLEGDRIALVGQNGSGKTTLLNIIANKEDDVFMSDVELGYVKQSGDFDLNSKILDLLVPLPDAAREAKVKEWFSRLQLSDSLLDQSYKTCSGGEKSKIALINILMQDAELLLLDEPTNHLDLDGIRFLQDWLNNEFQGTFILVSHDRFFLRETATKIVEIENEAITTFNESYDDYVETKARLFQEAQQQYETQREEKKRLKESMVEKERWSQKTHKKKRMLREKYGGDTQYHIRLKKTEKSQRKLGLAKSVLKQRMESISPLKPRDYTEYIKLEFSHEKSYKEVLNVKDASISVETKVLSSNINLDLELGDKVFIIGENGCGKTSFLNHIIDNKECQGKNLKISYIEQERKYPDITLLKYLQNKHNLDPGTIRDYLAKVLFRRDDYKKKCNNLSGGEAMRLALLEAIIEKANFLILDEPTNNLDIQSIEVLEEALNRFTGTLLIVTHDREMIRNVAEKVYELDKNGLHRLQKEELLN